MGCKWQPGSGCSLHSKDREANPGWPASRLKQISFFIPKIPFSSKPPASFYSPGRGLGLSVPLGFCKSWITNSAFCGQLEAAPGGTPAQLRMSLPRWKVKGRRWCRGAVLPSLTGQPAFPSREEKTGKENRIYYFQAIIHTPISIFQIVSSFYISTFR